MSETQFAMVSDWMEKGSINEFVRANPDINRLELVSVLPKYRATLSLLVGPVIQLGDAARGLTYIHRQGMIHGDLKGVRSRYQEQLPYLTILPGEG